MMVAAMTVAVGCKNDKVAAGDAQEVVATAEATNFNVDTAGSVINWIGAKPAGQHTGTISLSEGTVGVLENKITSGSFVIDMNSIVVTDLTAETGKDNLEAHLKGTGEEEGKDHFFNVTTYPTGKFEITSVEYTSETNATINGNLTLKDITKNVSFPANITVNDNTLTLTSETFKINRVDWNVNYGSKSVFDNLADKFINDEIELSINVKANL